MLAIHFGAGNIGRGFIGEILHRNGCRIGFVDVNDSLISRINEEQEYTVNLARDRNKPVTVNNIYALHSRHNHSEVVQDLARADIITASVGVSVLPHIAPVLAEGLKVRAEQGGSPVHVIACENAVGASTVLKEAVKKALGSEEDWNAVASVTGFPDSAVDRIVPGTAGDHLDVTVEPFHEWIVHREGMVKEEKLEGVHYVDDLIPYIERKLFTVNTGHACLAYLGFAGGIETVAEAAENPDVRRKAEGVLRETGILLMEKYGFSDADLQDYHRKIMKRFENRHLSDPVTRVGRNPLRKLGADDRILSPLVQLYERGIDAPHLIEVAGAAFLFSVREDEESMEIQQMIETDGIRKTVSTVTGLAPDHTLTEAVAGEYERLKNEQ
ncbi:mannitol-1-phosphate 5-dehydrogenase [Alteribacter natronophilus]|uniref:mannitol-1-phosphate 5-dehydrogenase n=1 Tax=Alteribacter natronophilus TaxID=2583810 RepID=UPI00110E2C74|nr:mannitol-1-phosphate 5-dehydrogenase [Alteribacter natronophilus]TMW70067.1 mannitol-1-phosphate 5-dehydrogenase [Alteribacter natronophilus]